MRSIAVLRSGLNSPAVAEVVLCQQRCCDALQSTPGTSKAQQGNAPYNEQACVDLEKMELPDVIERGSGSQQAKRSLGAVCSGRYELDGLDPVVSAWQAMRSIQGRLEPDSR
eukprot:6203788-Pleurochrysis_carterae.AAC.1